MVLSILIALVLVQDPLMKAPFEAMEKGIRAGDAEVFRAAWHPAGYAHNLVGRRGVAGSDVFPAASGRSYPRPDLDAAVRLGEGAAIVPARIWAFLEEEFQDAIDVLVVKHGTGWLVLGMGGSRKEVEALADRWLKNEIKEPVLKDAPQVKGVAAVFSGMEKALRAGDAAAFEVLWHAEGHARNVVGRSGIPGASLFAQGSFKKWFPKPDLGKVLIQDDTAVVPSLIWSWEQEQVVDGVTFVLVKQGDSWVALGGGEDRSEALALAERWRRKEPLDPPVEK